MKTPPPRSPQTLQIEGLPRIHPHAAALDISADEIVVALPPDRDSSPVRAYRTFTPDLHALVDWFVSCKIDTVALESTGVYWIPIYELLEAQGIVPYLVNARHIKMVLGRKTDWNAAQWLQKLHALGLLHGSFRPDAELVALRTLVRHRAELIRHRAPHILHLQQALQQMNIQLERVLSDIMGVSGQAIVRAIVAGERDPVVLAQHRNPGCRSSSEMLATALTGTWKEELVFVLAQSLDAPRRQAWLYAHSSEHQFNRFRSLNPSRWRVSQERGVGRQLQYSGGISPNCIPSCYCYYYLCAGVDGVVRRIAPARSATVI